MSRAGGPSSGQRRGGWAPDPGHDQPHQGEVDGEPEQQRRREEERQQHERADRRADHETRPPPGRDEKADGRQRPEHEADEDDRHQYDADGADEADVETGAGDEPRPGHVERPGGAARGGPGRLGLREDEHQVDPAMGEQQPGQQPPTGGQVPPEEEPAHDAGHGDADRQRQQLRDGLHLRPPRQTGRSRRSQWHRGSSVGAARRFSLGPVRPCRRAHRVGRSRANRRGRATILWRLAPAGRSTCASLADPR